MRGQRSLPATLAVSALLAAVVVVGLSVVRAWPHHVPGSSIVYPPECCQSAANFATGDCAPIDDRYVTEEPDGWHINLPAGSHPKLKTHSYSEIIPYASQRQPLDNSYHICLSNEGAHRFCFFPKPGAV